jgi:hypothetical protein
MRGQERRVGSVSVLLSHGVVQCSVTVELGAAGLSLCATGIQTVTLEVLST